MDIGTKQQKLTHLLHLLLVKWSSYNRSNYQRNIVGNVDLTPAIDTLTVNAANQPPDKPAIPVGPTNGKY